MRLRDDRRSFGLLRLTAALSGTLGLAVAITGADARPAVQQATSPTGPQADYPLVVGPTYSVAGTGFTPEDVLNYDQVGYVAADRAGGGGITGTHHTLPLPSYVEVTSLATGRTILVRLERRGPMNGTELIALSPGALAQLDATPGTPVRVRRVVPPEEQRALLRTGQSAPLRMDTPMSLVEVLKRKLPGQGGAKVVQTIQTTTPAPAEPMTVPAARSAGSRNPKPAATPAPVVVALESSRRAHGVPALPPLGVSAAPAGVSASSAPPTERPQRGSTVPKRADPALTRTGHPAQPLAAGRFVVQAGAFSVSGNADKAAHAVGGLVSKAGALFHVRTGPFATRAQAQASLAKVRAAGYRDARIQTSG